MLKWKVVSTIALSGVLTAILCAQDGRDRIPPQKYFLPLNSVLAHQISKTFSVEVEDGLYFTDQSSEILAHEFRGSSYRPMLTSLDCSYLSRDEYNEQLFGNKVWRVRGLRKLLYKDEKVVGTMNLKAADEFAADVAWVNRYRPETKETVKQLWLSRKNGERWLLLEESDKGKQSNRLMWMPKHFMALSDGIIAFPKHWEVTRRYFQGEHLTKFKLIDPSKTKDKRERKDTEFTIATVNVVVAKDRRAQLPLFVHNVSERKILFAGWADDNPVQYVKKRGRVLNESRAEADLFVWDLQSNHIQRIFFDAQWPFSLALSGMFTIGGEGLQHRALLWGEGSQLSRFDKTAKSVGFDKAKYQLEEFSNRGVFATDRSTKQRFMLSAGGALTPVLREELARFQSVGEDSLKKIENMGYPPDLLTELRLGVRTPLHYIPHVANRLLRVLSQPERTLAVLLYNEGDRPSELVSGFLRAVDTAALENTHDWQELDSAFLFHSDLFFGRFARTDLPKALPVLREVTAGKKVVTYLEDFPAAVSGMFSKPADATVSAWLERMRLFNKQFGDCTDKGDCRVVLSMRNEVFQAMARMKGGLELFETANPVQFDPVKDVPAEIRQRIARLHAQRYETLFNIPMTEEAFSRAYDFSVKMASFGEQPQNLGFYDPFFLDLFTFARLTLGEEHSGTSKGLDRFLVTQYETDRTNRPRLEEHPLIWEGKDKGKAIPTLFWVQKGKEKQKAVSALLNRVWRDDRSQLIWSPRLAHAIIRIPGTYKESELAGAPKTKQGALDVLRPAADEEDRFARALDFAPETSELAIHPKGFFFVYTDDKQMSLAFYELQDPGLEGKVRILKPAPIPPKGREAPIPIADYQLGVIRVSFENDRAIISRRDGGAREVFSYLERVEPKAKAKAKGEE